MRSHYFTPSFGYLEIDLPKYPNIGNTLPTTTWNGEWLEKRRQVVFSETWFALKCLKTSPLFLDPDANKCRNTSTINHAHPKPGSFPPPAQTANNGEYNLCYTQKQISHVTPDHGGETLQYYSLIPAIAQYIKPSAGGRINTIVPHLHQLPGFTHVAFDSDKRTDIAVNYKQVFLQSPHT